MNMTVFTKKYLCLFLLTSFTLYPRIVVSAEASNINIEHIINTEETVIAGTLTLPQESLTDSLVIMLSGSGPQDRDETLDGFRIFHHIAKHLASQGIASFRFDDRGVGKSTGNFGQSTLSDHTDDVAHILNYFSTHKEHTYKRFILLGHSQGGIVAANVAVEREDIDKVILMAAPSVPLIDIVLYQVRQEYTQLSINKELVEQGVSAHNRLMWAITNNSDIEGALENFNTTLYSVLSASPLHQHQSKLELKKQAAAQTKEFEIVYALPSLTSFLYHDPAKNIEDFSKPVLGLFGGKDLQVTIDQNKDITEKALLTAGANYHLSTFEHANHYFQHAETGLRQEYPTLDKQFVEGFLNSMSSWIVQNEAGQTYK